MKKLTVSQLLAFAQSQTPAQLTLLALNMRADGSLSAHGKEKA